ncbi:MAG: putative membrane protein [Glaciecola sp.]|jgi:uncharacterized membrane protein
MSKSLLISLLAIILCFGAMDAIWLGVIADEIYQQEMQGMLRLEYPVWPWVSFYLIYALSITILAVQPSFNNLSNPLLQTSKVILVVALRGFMLGLAAYGTYNLTNYAILANWSLKIALIDWAWGCFITLCSAICAGVAVSVFSNKHNNNK